MLTTRLKTPYSFRALNAPIRPFLGKFTWPSRCWPYDVKSSSNQRVELEKREAINQSINPSQIQRQYRNVREPLFNRSIPETHEPKSSARKRCPSTNQNPPPATHASNTPPPCLRRRPPSLGLSSLLTLLSASDARSSTLVFMVAEKRSVCLPMGQDLTSSATSSWKPSSSRRSACQVLGGPPKHNNASWSSCILSRTLNYERYSCVFPKKKTRQTKHISRAYNLAQVLLLFPPALFFRAPRYAWLSTNSLLIYPGLFIWWKIKIGMIRLVFVR